MWSVKGVKIEKGRKGRGREREESVDGHIINMASSYYKHGLSRGREREREKEICLHHLRLPWGQLDQAIVLKDAKISVKYTSAHSYNHTPPSITSTPHPHLHLHPHTNSLQPAFFLSHKPLFSSERSREGGEAASTDEGAREGEG